jgi:hypothetical protein
MLKMIVIVILTAVGSSVGLSQQTNSVKLFPFDSGSKCGYINQHGEIIVVPQFDICKVFNEGLAGVSLSEKSGYIDGTGKIVIPIKFDYFYPESFWEGLAPIQVRNKNGKLEQGYVDKSGKVKLLAGVSETDFFSEGLAAVKKNEKYGYIDKTMKFVIPPQFDSAGSFDSGRAAVLDIYRDRSKQYYIDTSGRKVFDCDTKFCSGFSEGLAMIENKYNQHGYIDINGKVVIKPRFNYGCYFKEGLSCVQNSDEKWGYIDKSGEFVIQPQFDEAEDFSPDGVAPASLNGKWGFIDKTGKFLVEPLFEKAEWINGLGFVEFEGKKRYINSKNIFVW